jgi:hypothetical protein
MGQPFRQELEYALRSIENGLSETELGQLENLQFLWGVDNQRADMRAKFKAFDEIREVSRLTGITGTGPGSGGFSHAFFYIQARTQYLERLPDTTRAEFVKNESALRELCKEGILSYDGYCAAIHLFISDKIKAITQKFPTIKV